MNKFDKTYLLLLPLAANLFLSFVRIRFRIAYGLALAAVWFITQWLQYRCRDARMAASFTGAFVFLAAYYIIQAYVRTVTAETVELSLYSQFCSSVLFVMPLGILFLSVANRRIRELRMLVWTLLGMMAFSALMSLRFDVGESRLLATGIDDATSIESLYERYDQMMAGVASPGAVYAMMAFLVYVLFDWFYVSKWTKVSYAVVSMCFLIGMYRAAYSLAFVALVIGGVFLVESLAVRKNIAVSRGLFLVTAILIVLFVANPSVLSPLADVVKEFGNLFETEEYRMRVESIAAALSGDKDTYAFLRAELFVSSFRAFLENPFWGYAGAKLITGSAHIQNAIGGHSYYLDALAGSGLFVFLLLVFGLTCCSGFIHLVFRRFCIARTRIVGWYAVLFVIITAGTINQLNAFEVYFVLFLIIPGLMLPIEGTGGVRCRNY